MSKSYFLYLAWLIALIGTITSLVFSEIFHLIPCTLCWYQRLLLYPLVIILAVGIYRRDDKNLLWYALPFSLIGVPIALYHWLLQLAIIPEGIVPCVSGVSCAEKQLAIFGFLTIPALSLIAFTIISLALIIYTKANDHRS